jgi:hypothetical protein
VTGPALPQEPGTDIRAVILARVMPHHEHSFRSLDQVTREQARTITLELLAQTRRVVAEVEAYADQLAHAAALTGATHEERGQAVGLSRERARRKWPWPAARR